PVLCHSTSLSSIYSLPPISTLFPYTTLFRSRIELLRHADCPVEKSALRPLERCPRLHDVFEHLFHETWNGSHDVWFYLFNVLSDMLESFGYVNGDSDIKVRIDNHALVCVAGREES